MANAALQKALQIFEQVCDLPADKREQALNDACGADLALRSRVEAMLRQDTNETHPLHVNLFANNSSAQANDTQGSVDEHPAQIGGYRIVRKIGEGAMGTVYEGRQQSPKRAVAIKVLRPTGNWHSLQKRFEHEAFILGRLQHPGIAQIIEAGRQPAPGGEQLYLVMELVRGRELLKYAENKPLDSRQRLELFIRICEAVQHAHQKAVIHRDLKPANILVVDDESTLSRLTDTAVRVSGQPKILDFGVARLTDSDLHVTTVATGMGQMIGTLPYMSPEQIVGDPQEIDTRADVYSLGVVLHELLTGRLPYDLRNRSMFEAARIIREDPPQRLSAINRALRGDLDTIVGKALEKDKSRRYQSASELAADVRAFLDSAPIAARRDSRFYVLQKTLKRYKLATSMAAALLLLSIGSAIAFASLYRKADAAALAAQRESLHAQEAEAAARRQARRAFGISSFLQHVLQSADSRALGRDAKIVDSLEYARNRIDEVLADDLESKTGAYYALSQTYGDLGQYPTAEALIRQALQLQKTLTPDGSSELGDLVNHHGAMLFALGRFDEAVVLFNEALALHKKFSPDDASKISWDLSNLGGALMTLRKLDEAEPLIRESLRLREGITNADARERVSVATDLNKLAGIMYLRRNFAEGAQRASQAVKIFEENFAKAPDPNYPNCLNTYANCELELGNKERAGQLFQQSLDVIEKLRGPEHPETANAILGNAQFERIHGDAQRAESLYRRALEIRRKASPPNSPTLGQALSGLGATLVKQGRAAEAEPYLKEVYELRTRTEPDAPTTAITLGHYAECLMALGRDAEAEQMLRRAHEINIKTRGSAEAEKMHAALELIEYYDRTNQPEKSAALQTASASAPAPK